MPYTPPTVNYRDDAGVSFSTLTGVQSAVISRGRQKFYDPFPASQLVVELIPANSYAVPFAIGGILEVRDSNTNTAPCYFSGRVTDIQRQYDMPYNSVTGAAPGDRFILTATGTGVIGTNQITKTWSATTVEDIVGSVGVACRVQVDFLGSQSQRVSGQTVTAGALDIINQLLRTNPSMLDDFDNRTSAGFYQDHVLVFPVGYGFPGTMPSFTDTGSGYKFRRIEFLSSLETTFSQVNVIAPSLTTQTTQAAQAPYNSLNYETYNETNANALALSQYVYSIVANENNATPYVLTTDTNCAPSCMSLATIYSSAYSSKTYLGQEISLTFRGSTVNATIQGISSAFYADYAAVQLFLAPSIGASLILDSTDYGVLDTNRLGYP